MCISRAFENAKDRFNVKTCEELYIFTIISFLAISRERGRSMTSFATYLNQQPATQRPLAQSPKPPKALTSYLS